MRMPLLLLLLSDWLYAISTVCLVHQAVSILWLHTFSMEVLCTLCLHVVLLHCSNTLPLLAFLLSLLSLTSQALTRPRLFCISLILFFNLALRTLLYRASLLITFF